MLKPNKIPRALVVLGLNYGDEGKGKITSMLCDRLEGDTIVARFSGGSQASHKVMGPNLEHEFSIFGSGTLQGHTTYLTKDVAINLDYLILEYNALLSKGVLPKLYIDPKCPIITKFDEHAQQEDTNNRLHGTCGMGVGTTIEREENLYSLLAEDVLKYPDVAKIKMEMLANYYKFSSNNTYIDNYISTVHNFFDEHWKNIRLADYSQILSHEYDNIVFEGSQGLMLDKKIGFFPHVTRSNTDLTNIYALGVKPDEVHLVSRSYLTRHGTGPVYHGAEEIYFDSDKYEHNVSNIYQGKFKKYLLNIDLMRYAIHKLNVHNFCDLHLHMTHMDELSKFKGKFINRDISYQRDTNNYLETVINFIRPMAIEGHDYYSPYSFT